MKRVLIVSPHWPPLSNPDMHRARMSLPFFHEFGWEPLVLRTDPDEEPGTKDPMLCHTIPEDVRVWQAGCLPHRLTGWFGLHSVSLRSYFHLRNLGSNVIRNEKPDLVYFSTTMFPVMVLGPYWRRRFGVPFLVDMQDPWYHDYYHRNRHVNPPGGWFKYGISHFAAGKMEPRVMKEASHIITVSPSYPNTFMKRHRWLKREHFTVLPFGAAEFDYELVDQLKIEQKYVVPRDDGGKNWVYAGAINGAMLFAVRALFRAVQRGRTTDPDRVGRLRLHFIGTSYASGRRARKIVEPLAREYGLDDLVTEIPERIPYLEALRTLRDADALIVPGSEDAGYTASKIYPYILAEKPMLGIFHEQSSVVEVLQATRAGKVVTFRDGDDVETIALEIEREWLRLDTPPAPATNWDAFAPYTAREMTRRQCEIFDAILMNQNGRP